MSRAYPQSLSVIGGWTTSIPSTNVTEAGLNYGTGSTTSATNQSLMTVNVPKSVSVARVFIQKSDTSWDSRLVISALRTGSGTGNGNFRVTGGTTAQVIGSTPQLFFEVDPGSGNRVQNIPLQYVISGISVLLPVKAYTTTIIYTVTN